MIEMESANLYNWIMNQVGFNHPCFDLVVILFSLAHEKIYIGIDMIAI